MVRAWRRHHDCLKVRLQVLQEVTWKTQVAKLSTLFIKYKLKKQATQLCIIQDAVKLRVC